MRHRDWSSARAIRDELDAVAALAGFDAMKAEGGAKAMLLRQGGVGDWRNHLARAHWAAFDAAFDAQVGDGVALAEPLRFFQQNADVGVGMKKTGLPGEIVLVALTGAAPRGSGRSAGCASPSALSTEPV
mgnify:CR=1 FL=1